MPVTEIGDPRLQALFGASDPRDSGVRPTVRLPRKGLPPVVLAAIAIIFGVLLFMVLNERRTSQTQPSVRLRPDSAASAWQPPPTLYVPPEPAPVEQPNVEEQQPAPQPLAVPAPAPAPKPVAVQPVTTSQPMPVPLAPPPPAPQPRTSAGSPLVIDGGAPSASASAPAARVAPSLLGAEPQALERMRASSLANRSMTITQGTVIQAVLETAFNSTQPGFARAVVSRDVRSFDGTNVLIPRGSKLIGQYSADVAAGQKRAVIIWTRLIRPDGMTINMDSPAVDTLGRGGVPASVNTHFFARLGDALLQSTFGLGSLVAQRRISGPVVVLSGTGTGANAATAAAGQIAPTNSYTPTLTVPAGKSISVFVAHDLDFGAAGAAR